MEKVDIGDYSPLFAPFAGVEKFMLVAGHLQDCDRKDRPLAHPILDLYMKLIDEETVEMRDAYDEMKVLREKQSLTEEEYKHANELLVLLIDGFFDLLWVTMGAMLSTGIPIRAIWEEGERSNLTKIDPQAKKFLFREDGKLLKPKGWKPPNFAAILSKHFRSL